MVKLTNTLSEKQAVEETKLVFDLPAAHESYPLSKSYSRMLAQPIARRVLVDATFSGGSNTVWLGNRLYGA